NPPAACPIPFRPVAPKASSPWDGCGSPPDNWSVELSVPRPRQGKGRSLLHIRDGTSPRNIHPSIWVVHAAEASVECSRLSSAPGQTPPGSHRLLPEHPRPRYRRRKSPTAADDL